MSLGWAGLGSSRVSPFGPGSPRLAQVCSQKGPWGRGGFLLPGAALSRVVSEDSSPSPQGSLPWGRGWHLGCWAPAPSGWQLRAVPSSIPFCCSYGLCGIHYIDAGYLGFKAYFVAPRKGTVWVRGIRAVRGSGARRRPCAGCAPQPGGCQPLQPPTAPRVRDHDGQKCPSGDVSEPGPHQREQGGGWGWHSRCCLALRAACWDAGPQPRLFLQSISGSDWLNTVAAGDITGELVAAVLPDLAINPLNVKRSSDRRFVSSRSVVPAVPACAHRAGLGGGVLLGCWRSAATRPLPAVLRLGTRTRTFGDGLVRGEGLAPLCPLPLSVPCPHGKVPAAPAGPWYCGHPRGACGGHGQTHCPALSCLSPTASLQS